MTALPQDPRDWIGRGETRRELLAPAPAALLAATLDRAFDGTADPDRTGTHAGVNEIGRATGAELPLLWHWLYFLADAPHALLRLDGHPVSSGVLPPVPLPRRMFAGARLRVQRPLRIGTEVTRESRIADVSTKQGKSGQLLFLLIRHEYRDTQGLAMVEEQDVVYREAVQAVPPAVDPGKATSPVTDPAAASPATAATPLGDQGASAGSWTRHVLPDPALLFRYSALTFNAHRIHYDLPYTMQVEGYPGLVVQGMLVATLLADLLERHAPHGAVHEFRFRALAPLFCGAPFSLHGKPGADDTLGLWATDQAGTIAMEASARLA